MRLALTAAVLGWAGAASAAPPPEPLAPQPVAPEQAAPELVDRPLSELQQALAGGQITAQTLTTAYLERILTLDRAGPQLNAIRAIAPDAAQQAIAADQAHAHGGAGPLNGLPILIKDSIETVGLPTTAGSLALKDNVSERDAPLVARLRAAGAVILGKTNLSEWSNIRSTRSISGWSGLGGLVKNPYVLDRSPCGSSAGSAVAVAAGLAAAAIGAETDGSITCPAAVNGLVGLKPTVGLVSRTGVVPISSSQDSPGPITRTVTDAAILLTVLAGADPADPATQGADAHRTDYAAALSAATLKGKRLGVLTVLQDPVSDAVFADAVAALRGAGAEVVPITDYVRPKALRADERRVLLTELKASLNAYLAAAPPAVHTRSLADVIAFDAATPREQALFGDDSFIAAEATTGLSDPAYLAARDEARRLAGAEGIDKLLADHKLDALIAPTVGPASRIDIVVGDDISGAAASLPAVAGYPHLTVPMGQVRGLPVGLSFIGPAWSEAALLQLGYAFEQATHARRPPGFIPSLESGPGAQALAPAPAAPIPPAPLP